MRMPPGAEGAFAAGWAMTTVWPATVTEAERAPDDAPLPSTASVTVPLPLPVPPSLMLIHGECADADQSQPSGAATETDTVAPARATVLEVGDTV